MGTRYFSSVEKKDSRIKWEKADSATAEKLRVAARNKVSSVERITVFLPVFTPMVVLVVFFFMTKEMILSILSSNPDIPVGIIVSVFVLVFSVVILIDCIKKLPYLYPEKQQNIWVFRAKCSDVATFNMIRHFDRGENGFTAEFDRYLQNHACFQKGGVHIAIPLSSDENESNLIGKEYIFYKFNEGCGNRWQAVQADKLDEIA